MINIGGTTATTLNLGRTGQTQALLGNVTVAGTSGSVLTSTGTDWTSQAAGGGSHAVLDKNTTTVTVTNSFTETTLYTVSVPANTLGTNKMLRVTMGGTYLNNSGATKSMVVSIKYGATTLYSDTSAALFSGTALRGWRLEFILAANAATNAQKLIGSFGMSHGGATTTGTGDSNVMIGDNDGSYGLLYGTSAIDSTVAQTLLVTVTHNASDVNTTITRYTVITELIQ